MFQIDEKQKKKILIVAYYYSPTNNGGVQRIRAFYKYLQEFGYNVDILTTDVDGSIEGEKNIIRVPDKGYKYRNSKNIIVRYAAKIAIKLRMCMGIAYDWYSLWGKEVKRYADKYLNMGAYDLIVASYPPIVDAVIGVSLSKKYGIPLVMDYRDGLMYDAFPYIYKQSKIYLKKIMSLEKRISEVSSLQLVVNDIMREYYMEKYPNVVTISIPNGYDDNEVVLGNPVHLPKGINILYTGLIGESRYGYASQILKNIIMNNHDINFIFLGELEKKEKEELKIYDNVYMYGKVSRSESVMTQQVADALLLITGSEPGGTSGKIYEYIYANNKPIIHIGGFNNASLIIQETNSGETFTNEMEIELQQFLNKLKANVGIEYVRVNKEKYSRRAECEMLVREIEKII